MDKDERIQGELPRKKVKVEVNEFDQLRNYTAIVADTGDFTLIEKYQPQDSTTNPSLILQVAKNPDFKSLLLQSVKYGLKNFEVHCGHGRAKKKTEPVAVSWKGLDENQRADLINLIFDHICVSFGVKILEKIKGYVSTEVDAKLAFDKNETVKRAKRIVALYQEAGVDTSRILIKVASTWEGIKAGETLLKSKIKVNMTLIFHKIQAIACAQSGLFLISPFVGRILDWFKKENGKDYQPHEDPGVLAVTEIYNYYKKYGFKTIVMGASFRSIGEIRELAGCDKLTISPALLDELKASHEEVLLKLDAKTAKGLDIPEVHASEEVFRYELNRSKMATDLLSAGIRKFEDDGVELKNIITKAILSVEEEIKPQ